jgi:hypothetical protein
MTMDEDAPRRPLPSRPRWPPALRPCRLLRARQTQSAPSAHEADASIDVRQLETDGHGLACWNGEDQQWEQQPEEKCEELDAR